MKPYDMKRFAEYILWNARLDESQAGDRDCSEKYQQPQICRWYHSDAESEEEIKSLLRVKEESEKAGLKQHLKN